MSPLDYSNKDTHTKEDSKQVMQFCAEETKDGNALRIVPPTDLSESQNPALVVMVGPPIE